MKVSLFAVCIAILSACASKEKFTELGEKIASPIAVTVSTDGNYFYVANADHDRTYNLGSITVLDREGQKLRAVPTPRMARSLTVAGDALLVTFDRSSSVDTPTVHLYSLANPAAPVLRKTWNINCSPLNTVMRDNFEFFFVSCRQGELLVGSMKELFLKQVRDYGHARRAMYLDPKRGLLLSFVTDINRQEYRDVSLEDRITVKNGEEIAEQNDIPDDWEHSQKKLKQGQIFQFTVYDIFAAQKKSNPFPYTEKTDEFRWLYYSVPEKKRKTWRTNFWDAHPDPDDADKFYLSQRGAPGSSSNNVMQVTIIANPATKGDGTFLRTGEAFKFEKVYTSTDHQDLKFPGDIAITNIGGKKTLLVNNFRDFVNWSKDQAFFAITAKTLLEPVWQKSFNSDQANESYYQFAVNSQGTVVVSSFYGNKVFLFSLQPETEFTLRKVIE